MAINSFRQSPQKLLPLLESLIPRFEGRIFQPKSGEGGYITQEGVMVVYEAIDFVQKQKSLPPFKFSKGLYLAAKSHLRDMDENGLASHKGSNGSNLSERVDCFGRWRVLVAENIAFNDHSAEDILVNFVLDDGNVNRGHRENLFNEKLEVVGIACGKHSVHGHCSVLNFSGQMEEYLDLGEDDEDYREVYNLLDEFIGQTALNQVYLEDHELTEDEEPSEGFSNSGQTDTLRSSSRKDTGEEEDTPPDVLNPNTIQNYQKFESFKKRISEGKTALRPKEQRGSPLATSEPDNDKLKNELISPIRGRDAVMSEDDESQTTPNVSSSPQKLNVEVMVPSFKSNDEDEASALSELSEKISVKKKIRPLKMDKVSVDNKPEAESFEQLPLKKGTIDKIMKRNQQRRQKEQLRKQKRKDLKDTHKGFASAEKLTAKLQNMNNQLDTYLARKIAPTIKRRKRKRAKQGMERIEEKDEDRESIRKYRQIGVNSKWMRRYTPAPDQPSKVEVPQEQLQMFQKKAQQEFVEVNQQQIEVHLESVEIEKMTIEQTIREKAGPEEAKANANLAMKEIPDQTGEAAARSEEVRVDTEGGQIETEQASGQFNDVRILGQVKPTASNDVGSLRSEINSRMISGFISKEYGYNSDFDRSHNLTSDKASPPRSQLIQHVRNENLAEEELLSVKKASQLDVQSPGRDKQGWKEQVSVSALKRKEYLELKDKLSELTEDSEQSNHYFTWRQQKAYSIPLKLVEPSEIFDIQKEKERMKYEVLLEQERKIKQEIIKQKELELKEMLKQKQDKQYQTIELDSFLKELESTNKKLETYMKAKKQERKRRKEERKKVKMMQKAQESLEKEEQEEQEQRKSRLSTRPNLRYREEGEEGEGGGEEGEGEVEEEGEEGEGEGEEEQGEGQMPRNRDDVQEGETDEQEEREDETGEQEKMGMDKKSEKEINRMEDKINWKENENEKKTDEEEKSPNQSGEVYINLTGKRRE